MRAVFQALPCHLEKPKKTSKDSEIPPHSKLNEFKHCQIYLTKAKIKYKL